MSISPYRKGRGAFRFTAEVSYFVDEEFRKQGVGSLLLDSAIAKSKKLGFKTLIAILFETNLASIRLLKRFGFEQWGFMPEIGEIDGEKLNHVYYGLRF